MSSLTNEDRLNYVPDNARLLTWRGAVVENYLAARWRPGQIFSSGSVYAFDSCQAKFQNRSDVACVLRLQETDTTSSSGARSNLGSAVALSPRGEKIINVSPKKAYMELKSVAGTAEINMEMVTRFSWDSYAPPDKADTLFPPVLRGDANPSSPVKAASQVFTSATSWSVTHNLGFVASPTLIDGSGNDITSLATFSAIDKNGYTATFSHGQAGTAYSSH